MDHRLTRPNCGDIEPKTESTTLAVLERGRTPTKRFQTCVAAAATMGTVAMAKIGMWRAEWNAA